MLSVQVEVSFLVSIFKYLSAALPALSVAFVFQALEQFSDVG